MRLTYCDRCGAQGSERRANEHGVRVVRVTMEPMHRVLDLCGACRSDLPEALDGFLRRERRSHTEILTIALRDLRDSFAPAVLPETPRWRNAMTRAWFNANRVLREYDRSEER